MKVFITGVAGFGSHIADEFISLGHEVAGCDNLLGGYRDNIPDKVEFHEADLVNLDGLSKIMNGCDLVYHTACTAYEGLSVFSPSLVVQTLLKYRSTRWLQQSKLVKRFVHVHRWLVWTSRSKAIY